MDLDEFLRRAEELHGHLSPGVVAGGFMLDKALKSYEPGEFLNAVVETVVCLPDAVQILTQCTLGNGFMQVLVGMRRREYVADVLAELAVEVPVEPREETWLSWAGQDPAAPEA